MVAFKALEYLLLDVAVFLSKQLSCCFPGESNNNKPEALVLEPE